MTVNNLVEVTNSSTFQSEGAAPWLSIADINRPTLLLSPPLGLSAEIPNNAWMEDMTQLEREVNLPKALDEFHILFQTLSKESLVFLLPPYPGLQDLVYVANLGIVPPHVNNTVVLSNFRSVPRRGEDIVGSIFFSQLGYRILRAPYYFEGEADLKHLSDNVYVGAYGMRTSLQFLQWFEETLDAKVIPFEMNDPYCYHLDGCVLPLTDKKVAVCVDIADKQTIRDIERYAEIIPVSQGDARSGALNSVVNGRHLLNDSIITSLSKNDSRYERELSKVQAVERMAKYSGLNPILLPMSEFEKSGACLSCLVMHLNWY